MAAAHPSRLQLYGTGSASGTAVAQVTIPSAGKLVGVYAELLVTSITAGAVVRIEITKVNNNQIATNGALDPILEIGQAGNFVTSGLAQNGVNQFFPLNVSVRQGEIIYLHATVGGTATYYANFILMYG